MPNEQPNRSPTDAKKDYQDPKAVLGERVALRLFLQDVEPVCHVLFGVPKP